MTNATSTAPASPIGLYLKIYAALMILLVATVAVSYINLGPFNIVVALAIAITKAALVIIFFMHVNHSPKLIWLYAVVGFIWVTYLLAGVFGDVWTRGASWDPGSYTATTQSNSQM